MMIKYFQFLMRTSV